MLRLVIDTNTLLSGFGWSGPPAAVVDAVLAGQAGVLLSPPLLAELARVLRYPKLAGVFPDRIGSSRCSPRSLNRSNPASGSRSSRTSRTTGCSKRP